MADIAWSFASLASLMGRENGIKSLDLYDLAWRIYCDNAEYSRERI
jgi:hypothetical protein